MKTISSRCLSPVSLDLDGKRQERSKVTVRNAYIALIFTIFAQMKAGCFESRRRKWDFGMVELVLLGQSHIIGDDHPELERDEKVIVNV